MADRSFSEEPYNSSDIRAAQKKINNLALYSVGGDYTLTLSNEAQALDVVAGSDCEITVPNNSSVAFPIGTQIPIIWGGDGQPSVVGASGVDIISDGEDNVHPRQNGVILLCKRATNQWYLWGVGNGGVSTGGGEGELALNPPGSLTATVDGDDIVLDWIDTNSSPDESSIEVRKNSSNTTIGSTLEDTLAAGETTYTDPAPGPGTWYYFVKYIGSGGTANSTNASANATISAGTFLPLSSTAGSNQLTESPTGTWTADGGGQGLGFSADSIPASGLGRIQAKYLASNNQGAVIGLQLTAAPAFYSDMKWGIWPNGAGTYTVVNNATPADSGVSWVVNDVYGVVKLTSNTAQAFRSIDNGATLIMIGSPFAYADGSEMFGACHIASGGNKASEVKGIGFS